MKKIIVRILIIIILIALVITGYYAYQGYQLYQQVNKEASLQTRVENLKKKEDYVSLEGISDIYIEMVIESEDQRFYSHHGVDYIGLTRALITNLTSKSLKEGGSTITQQLAKNLCLSFEKQLSRKFAEVYLAWDLENEYPKDEILEMYLNITYLGQGNYGIKAACNYYYDIEPSQINKQQAQALVKTLKAPSVNNPETMGE